MAIIVNGVNIPTNGNYLIVNGVAIDKVVANGVVVWERIIKISPSNADIKNYINISCTGSTENEPEGTCADHPGAPVFSANVWFATDTGKSEEATFIVAPKPPYTKIKATFHHMGLRDPEDWTSVSVNGTWIEHGNSVTLEASSFTIKCLAETDGWDTHWKTEANCCMYDVTLS